ncbi:15947_t:CDS:2, partial [Gigaspora rosea]
VTSYAKRQGFKIRLGKIEKNSNGNIRKRTIFCSREGSSIKNSNKNIRNLPSQHCNCKFMVRASLDSKTGLWYIISAHLEHNHSMILSNHQHFMINERIIPIEGGLENNDKSKNQKKSKTEIECDQPSVNNQVFEKRNQTSSSEFGFSNSQSSYFYYSEYDEIKMLKLYLESTTS